MYPTSSINANINVTPSTNPAMAMVNASTFGRTTHTSSARGFHTPNIFISFSKSGVSPPGIAKPSTMIGEAISIAPAMPARIIPKAIHLPECLPSAFLSNRSSPDFTFVFLTAPSNSISMKLYLFLPDRIRFLSSFSKARIACFSLVYMPVPFSLAIISEKGIEESPA